MKNLFSILSIVFLTSICLISCKKDIKEQEKTVKILLSKTTTSSTITTYDYDENGNIIEAYLDYFSSPINNISYVYTYVSNNQLKEYLITPDDTIRNVLKFKYNYNGDGKVSKISSFIVKDGEEDIYEMQEATYSSEKISINITKYVDATTYLSVEYYLDSKGNLYQQKTFRPNGDEWIITEYPTYDDKSTSSTSTVKTSFYSNKNNYLSVKITDLETGNISEGTYTYEYNEDGYPTKRTTDTGVITDYEYIKK